MTEFTLCREEVEYATAHPYNGCYYPERAALGRVAEPMLVTEAERIAGLRVEQFNSPLLPEKHKKILGCDRRHDGLLFDEDNHFWGVIEAKLALPNVGNVVRITNELSIFNYCVSNNLLYIVSLGEMVNKRTLTARFMGIFNLPEHKDALKGTDISVEVAKKYLIS